MARSGAPLWASIYICFALLWWLIGELLERAAHAAAPSGVALLAFLLLVAACAFTLLLSLLPLAALRQLGPRAAKVLGIGAATGLLAWGAGVASGLLWEHMQRLTLYLVFSLMLPFSERIAFAPDEALIGTEDFLVEVAPECSGIEGIGLICVVMGVFLWSARERLRFPRALWLLPLAVLPRVFRKRAAHRAADRCRGAGVAGGGALGLSLQGGLAVFLRYRRWG